MLTIRAEQIHALQDALSRRWLEQHLRASYPEQCKGISSHEFHEFLRVQMKRARGYGFLTDNQIRRYVHVAFLLGGDFDRNPDCEWAQVILLERGVTARRRAEALQNAVLRHLEAQASAAGAAAAGV